MDLTREKMYFFTNSSNYAQVQKRYLDVNSQRDTHKHREGDRETDREREKEKETDRQMCLMRFKLEVQKEIWKSISINNITVLFRQRKTSSHHQEMFAKSTEKTTV